MGSPTGGTWSASGIASITSGGIVTINAVGAGSITYRVANAAGCTNSRTMSGTGFACAARGNAVGSEQATNNSRNWSIFPNPAKSYVSLNLETLVGTGSIVISDLYGKTVKIQTLSIGNNVIDITNIAKGLYFISTITTEGKTTKKLIVE